MRWACSVPEEVVAVAEHLIECPHCAEERRRFAAFLAEPDEPPQPAVARLLRRLFAQPVSSPSPAMALRGGEDGGTSRYCVDGYALTLSVQQVAGRAERVLIGLLLGDQPPAAAERVRLYAGERLAQTGALDELGSFVLDDVPAGEYRLELALPDAVIVVDAFGVA